MELERRVWGFLPFSPPIFYLKSSATKCLLWVLLVSYEQPMGVVWLQPISQGEKTLRNSSLAGSVGFCEGRGGGQSSRGSESGLTPQPGWVKPAPERG